MPALIILFQLLTDDKHAKSKKEVNMATGTVKWFNNAKGYGFILPDNGGEDLFAHYSTIEMEGYKTLKAGQAVSFDIIAGDKGSHAVHITASDVEESSSNTAQHESVNSEHLEMA